MATEMNMMEIICDGLGCVDYEDLLKKLEKDEVENVLKNSDMFIVIEQKRSKKILLTCKIRRCKTENCTRNCSDLHLCKFQFLGQCKQQGCKYGHSLEDEHNSRVLHKHGLQHLNRAQLRVLLLLNDGSLLPNVCILYNRGSGDFGNCPEKDTCVRLHICEKYIRGLCDSSECKRSHDFHEPHPAKTLHGRGVSSQLIVSLLQIYRNILLLKDHRYVQDHVSARGRENPKAQRNKDNCLRVHSKLPYKWQVKVDEVVGGEPVCFDTMMQGVHWVRRLSTESSVMEPRFSHTTKWSWYWENEDNEWIQFGSTNEMHRLSSVTSEDLELKYLHFLKENSCDVVLFTAGKQCYELNFRVMKQRNEFSSTETAVRRRPTFVSLVDVRAKSRGPNFSSRPGVPGFWEKTAIPESGFQLVQLNSSHKDYVRVQEHFNKTMKDFSILSIKRVQNKKLWEDFQTKRQQMKKANSHKKYGEAERLLFHGTNSRNVSTICQQNFDVKVWSQRNRVRPRDAIYYSDYMDCHGERVMFACRVLTGQYTKGASHFHRPPEKDVAGNVYDSCVNDVRNPMIYVVFKHSQVYPEFLITYEKTRLPRVNQSSIFKNVSPSERGVTSSHYDANAISSNSPSTEKASSAVSLNSSLVSPLNQRDDEMMMVTTESLNVSYAAPETEQSVHLKTIPVLTFVNTLLQESDQSLSRSVTNPVSSNSENPLITAKPSLTDNRLQSENSKDQNKNSTLWTSNISTEEMSQKIQKSAPLKSPEFNQSMLDSLDLNSCSSDKAKTFDASSTTCLSERENKTTIPCKSNKLPLGHANPKKEFCSSHQSLGSLSSTELSKNPAKTLHTSKEYPVSSPSDHQLPILDKPSTIDRSSLSKSKPELVIKQEYFTAHGRDASKYSHLLVSTSTSSSAGKLGPDSSSAKESKIPKTSATSSSSAAKWSRSDGSSSSSSVSFHDRQPSSSAVSSTPLNAAHAQQASRQRNASGAQNEQKQKCSVQ
ncbi:Poly [ADP-ribose] polymerase 12 [Bagarius yarrelli]|uniref:Poly [ADP-ribose] polymerase n=1 Tax=Bagarius yarrelli TaxID=175774 RepID=A0A556VA43_BAGYA|nr:Poly [ADP-ribose] polymerase 12 [Bagarius yarrelli]